jgi:hypothetical protein
VGLRSNEEPPVVGIDSNARIVDPTALDPFVPKDLVDSLQADSIFLAKLQVQPCLGACRHSAISVEVPSHVGETRRGPISDDGSKLTDRNFAEVSTIQ